MKCLTSLYILAMAALSNLLIADIADAQTKPLREQIVGTWSFLVTQGHRADGTTFDVFGPNPNGVLMFHPDGHFVLMNTRPGRAKYASGSRADGTAEEFKATALGSIAYFGEYKVDEDKKAFILKIAGSTYPNYEGMEQVRPVVIEGDEMRSSNPYPASGGSPLTLVLRRLKPNPLQ
jgi:hypothetical protein